MNWFTVTDRPDRVRNQRRINPPVQTYLTVNEKKKKKNYKKKFQLNSIKINLF